MRDYILEKHPDKVELFDICVKLGALKLETDEYWCYIKDGLAEDLYAEEPQEFAGIFKTSQMGYKLAAEKYPSPKEDELLELVKELHVTGDDMKKGKWQLLAEAYINAQN